MRLLQLKLESGWYFGLTLSESESLFTRLGRSEHRCAVVDTRSAFNSQWPVDARLVCDNDAEIANCVREGLETCDFVWARMRTLEANNSEQGGTSYYIIHHLFNIIVTAEKMKILNENIEKIWQVLPDGAVLMVVSAQGDTRDASRLMQERSAYQRRCLLEGAAKLHTDDPSAVFGQDKMDELERAVSRGVVGVGMVATKVE